MFLNRVEKTFTILDFCLFFPGGSIAYLYCERKEIEEERKLIDKLTVKFVLIYVHGIMIFGSIPAQLR